MLFGYRKLCVYNREKSGSVNENYAGGKVKPSYLGSHCGELPLNGSTSLHRQRSRSLTVELDIDVSNVLEKMGRYLFLEFERHLDS
jgi:hypothetical protein